MFTDTEFMTAKEKAKVLKQWRTFLAHGCQRRHFTKALYHHLTQHCGFHAHYNLDGFYIDYFDTGADRARFLSQFDDRDGPPRSVELFDTFWVKGDCKGSYEDINQAMIQATRPHLDRLLDEADKRQLRADLTQAARLLAAHDLTLPAEATVRLTNALPDQPPTQLNLPGT